MRRCLVLLPFLSFFLIASASSAPAQIRLGDFGFVVSGQNGAAGDPCWGFDCRPRSLTVRSGEPLEFTVRAPLGAPFVVLASTGVGPCLAIPGIHNRLVLDPALVLLMFAGNIDQRNFARYCYDGLTVRRWSLPPAAIGATVALQALAVVGTPRFPQTGVALSSAVQLTVR